MTISVSAIPETMHQIPPLPSKRIGVAHLLHTVAYGGPETILINWIRGQDRACFDVHLLCFTDASQSERPFVEAAEAAGLTVHRIPWNRSKPVLRSARQLSRYLQEHQIDILHCYNTYAEVVGVVARRLSGVKLATTKWMWGKLDWKRAVLQKLERLILPQFDRVTAQSEFAARLTGSTGAAGRPVQVLLSGMDQPLHTYTAAERDAARRQMGAGPEDVVLLHLARFYPEKAHDVLVKSFRLIVDQEPRTRLVLAGVGPTYESTQRLVDGLGLKEKVLFLGFRLDLENLLPLAEVQIHSSNMEGIPLALCSGLSAGLAVVATAVGGVPEIIEHEVSGLLVPSDDPAQLAEAALRLVRDPGLRRRLGSAARHFMEENYSVAAAVLRLETMYREMVA